MKKFILLSVALVFLSGNYIGGMEDDSDNKDLAGKYAKKFFDEEYGFETGQFDFNDDAFLERKSALKETENEIAGFSIHRMHFGSNGDVLNNFATYDHIEGTQYAIVNMVEAGKKNRMNRYHRVFNWKAPKKERGSEQGSYSESIIIFRNVQGKPIAQELSEKETDKFYRTAAIAFFGQNESSDEETSPKKKQTPIWFCGNGLPGYPGYVSQKDRDRAKANQRSIVRDALFLKKHLFYYLTGEHGPKYFQNQITAQLTAKLKVRKVIRNYTKVPSY